jgi:hypothetical protein
VFILFAALNPLCAVTLRAPSDVVSAKKVVRAGDIAAHEAACGMAGKAMARKTIPGKTMAGECAAAHAMRREPAHATAVRMETATPHTGSGTTAHAEGARTTPARR